MQSDTKITFPTNEGERLIALKATGLLDSPADSNFDALTKLAKQLCDAPIALITLLDETRQWFKSNFGLAESQTPREISFCTHTILSEDPLIIYDASQHPGFKDNPLVFGPPHFRFYAGFPLIDKQGFALGALCVIDTKPRQKLSEYQIAGLKDIANLVMDQINTRYSNLYLDRVSQTPNRLKLQRDINTLIHDHKKEKFHLCVIDTTKYEQWAALTQSLGHSYADQFIKSVVDKLYALETENASLYNISVYRFAWLITATSQNQIDHFIEQLEQTLTSPTICSSLPLTMDSSIGISCYPDHAKDAEELIRSGISAVIDAKKQVSRIVKYDSAKDAKYKQHFQVLCELPNALDSDDQLYLVYQPKIDLNTNQCIGAEALIRWQHPEMGLIPPDLFIPLAENTLLINRVTDWVISHVLQQVKAWRYAMPVAINVSVSDLVSDTFVETLEAQLATYNVPPELITLEITETAIMKDHEAVIRALRKVHQLGLQISIDDFGTGYSSFAYLKYFSIDQLKIDKTFIGQLANDPKDKQLTNAIINVADQLEISSIAEGIEDRETFEWLRDNNCQFAQGYYISKPLLPEDFEKFIA